MSSPVRFFLGLPREAQGDLPEIPTNPVPNQGPEGGAVAQGEHLARESQGQLFGQLGAGSLQRLCATGSETPCLETIEANLAEANLNNLGRYYDTLLAISAEAQGMQQMARSQGMVLATPPEFHAIAVRVINEVLHLLTSPRVQGSWSSNAGPLGLRDTAKFLFNILQFGGALLHSNAEGALSPPHRSLLLRLAERTQAFVSANQTQSEASAIPVAQRPNPLPGYLVSFVDAQVSVLGEDSAGAIAALASARQQIQADDIASPLTPEEATGLRNQVRLGVNATLFQLANDPSAILSLNARTRTTLSALGYLSLITRNADQEEELSEAEQTQQVQQVQQFQFLAAILLNDGLAGQDASAVLEAMSSIGQLDDQSRGMLGQMLQGRDGATPEAIQQALDEYEVQQRTQLIEQFQQRFGSNPEFRTALNQMGIEGDITSEDWTTLFENARTVASHILEHQSETPFNVILTQDGEQRGLTQAGAILDRHPMLRARVLQALGMQDPGDGSIEGEMIAFMLAHYGGQTNNLLDASIPVAERSEGYTEFAEAMLTVSLGLEGEGLDQNYTQPVQGLIESFQALAVEHETYLPAFQLFLTELSQTQQIAPDVAMPESLQNIATRALENNTGFSFTHVMENTLLSPEFWGMTIFGTLAAGVGEMLFLRAAGTEGRLGALVRGGRVTGWGHWAIGTGVALSMNVVGSAIYAMRRDDMDFWTTENWSHIASGSLFAGAAIGMTIGVGPALSRRMGILPGTTPSLGQRFGMHLGSVGLGTAFMGFGAMANRSLYSGEWQWASGEEWAETAITLWTFDRMSHWAWRPIGSRFWPEAMVGPHSMRGIESFAVEPMIARRPGLATQRSELTRYLAREMARGRFPYDLSEQLGRERIPLFDLEAETPLRWVTRESYASQEGEVLYRSPEFNSQMRAIRAEARALLSQHPRARHVWIEASREADGTLVLEPSLRPTADRSRRFTIDNEGTLDNLSTLGDPILLDALMRVVEARQVAAREITVGTGPEAESTFTQAQEIASNTQHPVHRRLIQVFTQARRALQAQIDGGLSQPEIYVRLRRDGERVTAEVLEEAPPPSEMEGVLRVHNRGYSGEAVRAATASDRLLGLLLETLHDSFFPVPVGTSVPGTTGDHAGPTDVTVGVRPAPPRPRARSPRPSPPPVPPAARRSVPPAPPALPTTTDLPGLAEQIRAKYPEITGPQLRQAAEILAAQNFTAGYLRVQLEVASTTGSVGTHPTINVFRTTTGEFHFMVEGHQPPAGEFWGSFRIARNQVIDVQSVDPVFQILLGEGMEYGSLMLGTLANQFPEPVAPESEPPPPPAPSPQRPRRRTGDPIGGTTQRRAVSQELVQRSQQRGDEATEIFPTEAQEPLVEESRSGPMPEEAQPTEEFFDEVDPLDVIELEPSGVDPAPLPMDARPTRRPDETPGAAGGERLPRPTPLPNDLTGAPASPRTPTPPPLPPRRPASPEPPVEASSAAEAAEADPIPLIRERVLGISAQDTLRLEGVADQIEIQRLVGELETLPIPEAGTQGTESRFERIYIVHNPGEQPAFDIMPRNIVDRMVAADSDMGFFILNRQLVWDAHTNQYQVRRVSWSRGSGLPEALTSLLQRIFTRD